MKRGVGSFQLCAGERAQIGALEQREARHIDRVENLEQLARIVFEEPSTKQCVALSHRGQRPLEGEHIQRPIDPYGPHVPG